MMSGAMFICLGVPMRRERRMISWVVLHVPGFEGAAVVCREVKETDEDGPHPKLGTLDGRC
jgi:hypothetical protein